MDVDQDFPGSPRCGPNCACQLMEPIGSNLQDEADLFALHCAPKVSKPLGPRRLRARSASLGTRIAARQNLKYDSCQPTHTISRKGVVVDCQKFSAADQEILLLHQKLARLGLEVGLDDICTRVHQATSRLSKSPDSVRTSASICTTPLGNEDKRAFTDRALKVPPLRLASALSRARTPRARSERQHVTSARSQAEESLRSLGRVVKDASLRRPATTRGRLEHARAVSTINEKKDKWEDVTNEERIPCTLVIRTSRILAKTSNDNDNKRPATARPRLEQTTSTKEEEESKDFSDSEMSPASVENKVDMPQNLPQRQIDTESHLRLSSSPSSSLRSPRIGSFQSSEVGSFLSPRTNRREQLGIFAGPDTPGPGAYDVTNNTFDSLVSIQRPYFASRSVSVGRERRFRLQGQELEARSHPGPNVYNVSRSCFSYHRGDALIRPKGVFSTDSARKPGISERNGLFTPGPGQYDVLRDMDPRARERASSRRFKFGTEIKIPLSCSDKERSKVPGPGSYNYAIPETVHSSNIASGPARFVSLYPKSIVPGPGAYAVERFFSSKSPSEIAAGIPPRSKAMCQALEVLEAMKWSPSPGAYDQLLPGREIGTAVHSTRWFGAPGGRDRPAVGDPISHHKKIPSSYVYSPRFDGAIGLSSAGLAFPKASRYCKPIPFW